MSRWRSALGWALWALVAADAAAQMVVRQEGLSGAAVPFGQRFTLVVERTLPVGAVAVPLEAAAFAPWLVEQVEVAEQPGPPGSRVVVARVQVRATGVGAVPARELCLPYVAADGSAARHCGTLPGLHVLSGLPEPAGPVEWAVLPRVPVVRLWPWLVGLVLLCSVGIAWRRQRRRAPATAGLPMAAPAAAESAAAQALRRLRALVLPGPVPAAGQQEFAAACSGVLREYLAAQYRLPAAVRTSQELVAACPAATDRPAAIEALRQSLLPCDLVKFAARALPPVEQAAVVAAAVAFVQASAAPEEPFA